MRLKLIMALLVLMFLSASSLGSANAQTRFGVRGGFYLDRDEPFVGAHLVHKIQRGWMFNPNFEYVLVEPGSLFTINADLQYDLPSRSNATFWLGGGLGISHFSLEALKNTDTGLNLSMGVRFGRQPATPFLQVKVIMLDEAQLVLGGGVTF